MLESLESETPNIKDLSLEIPEKQETFNPNDYLTEEDWQDVIEMINNENSIEANNSLVWIKLLDERRFKYIPLDLELEKIRWHATEVYDQYFKNHLNHDDFRSTVHYFSILKVLTNNQPYVQEVKEALYGNLKDFIRASTEYNRMYDFLHCIADLRVLEPDKLKEIEKNQSLVDKLFRKMVDDGPEGAVCFRLAFPDQDHGEEYRLLAQEMKDKLLLRSHDGTLRDRTDVKLEYVFDLKVLSAQKIEYTDEGIKFIMNESKTDLNNQEPLPTQRSF